jgi:hypothetical protein
MRVGSRKSGTTGPSKESSDSSLRSIGTEAMRRRCSASFGQRSGYRRISIPEVTTAGPTPVAPALYPALGGLMVDLEEPDARCRETQCTAVIASAHHDDLGDARLDRRCGGSVEGSCSCRYATLPSRRHRPPQRASRFSMQPLLGRGLPVGVCGRMRRERPNATARAVTDGPQLTPPSYVAAGSMSTAPAVKRRRCAGTRSPADRCQGQTGRPPPRTVRDHRIGGRPV